MSLPNFRHIHIHIRRLAMTAGLLAASTCHAQLGAPAFHKLDVLQTMPESAGALVYQGATFAQRQSAGIPLFRYERRLSNATTGLTASHITRDPSESVIILESATLSDQYEVRRLEVTNRQSGFTGSVRVSNDGRHLEYELNENGKVSKSTEDVSAPIVCGPSLFGFILKRWEPLKAGAKVPVRMVVIQDKTTYGFDLAYEKTTHNQAIFTITPSSFLIRMAIAPLRVAFDASSRAPVRYEGRVPPMENIDGKLKNLDARVQYTSQSPVYR
jgi:hypothetical protein